MNFFGNQIISEASSARRKCLRSGCHEQRSQLRAREIVRPCASTVRNERVECGDLPRLFFAVALRCGAARFEQRTPHVDRNRRIGFRFDALLEVLDRAHVGVT